MKKELFFSLLLSLLLSCSVSDKSTLSDSYPQNAEDYFKNGYEKRIRQKFQEAIKDFNKAIELNPNYERAYFYRGDAKANLQDYHGAIEDYNKAIKFTPRRIPVVYHYYRGISYFKLNEKDKACSDWVIAGEFGEQEAFKLITKYCK